jgi:nucleoside-diphosphate-sugar epimerase
MEKIKMVRILLTGATGFLGSHLAKALSKHNFKIGCLVRKNSDTRALNEIADFCRIYRIDSTNKESLDSAIKDFQPKMVIHLASMILTEHQPNEVKPLILSNILFPSLLLESMAQHGVKLFLNTGTFWEFMDESEDYNPVCLYASTKKAFEDVLTFHTKAKGFKAITFRLYDMYGHQDKRKKLLWWLKQSIDSEEPIPFSPGEQQIDLVFIDDIISAYLKGIYYLPITTINGWTHQKSSQQQLKTFLTSASLFSH